MDVERQGQQAGQQDVGGAVAPEVTEVQPDGVLGRADAVAQFVERAPQLARDVDLRL